MRLELSRAPLNQPGPDSFDLAVRVGFGLVRAADSAQDTENTIGTVGAIFSSDGFIVQNRVQGTCAQTMDDTIDFMATEHIVALLIAERDKLTKAIEALQGARRRGRPPKNLFDTIPTPGNSHKKTRTFSAAQRKKQAARMKAYWAAKKKAAK